MCNQPHYFCSTLAQYFLAPISENSNHQKTRKTMRFVNRTKWTIANF